jgi:hypothetical protein
MLRERTHILCFGRLLSGFLGYTPGVDKVL